MTRLHPAESEIMLDHIHRGLTDCSVNSLGLSHAHKYLAMYWFQGPCEAHSLSSDLVRSRTIVQEQRLAVL